MNTTTVEFVYLAGAPFVDGIRFVAGETETTTEISDEYAALPRPFLDALFGLVEHQDSTRCWRCGDPVGFVLAEQPSGFERPEWTSTGLAREGDGSVAVLCEPCTPFVPTVAYPETAEVAR